MLDYILSKTVMLLFLLLTVAAFVVMKNGLADYFIQQSATQFAKTAVTRISSISGDPTTMSYKEVIPLAPGLSGGGKQISYEVNILCKREGADKILIGFAVHNPVGKIIGFAVAELYNPMGPIHLKLCHPPTDANFLAVSTKQHYIIVDKEGDSGSVVLSIEPSTDGLSGDCTPREVCP